MAFSAAEITCAVTAGGLPAYQALPVLGDIQWSQSGSASGTSTLTALLDRGPASNANSVTQYLIFRVYFAADSYVSIGKAPNAAASPRTSVPANTIMDFKCNSGDKIAWASA